MVLKSLELRGFKSFADKTELKFKEGVTAVVGPNGSGKSNISDAVRWVLGEQSVKTLRGGKMEDVIFSGTQYRKAVGLAQVSLTLDNSEGILPLDYNEINVSRRIFRSGETEYYINNNKCRLKDITALFMDTGIGKEGYSLIGQGKIEAILSGRAEDRRALLEEAAGIVKYKYRKNEAERKLANTDDNLVRIRDIISTYEERLEPLKIEREKALKFKDLSTELKEKEVSLIVSDIQRVENELKVFNENLETKKADLALKKEKLNDHRTSLKEIECKIEDLERKNTEEKLEYFKKKEGITKSYSDIKLFEERIANLENTLDKNKYEEYGLNKKIEEILKEKKFLEDDLENEKKIFEKFKEEIVTLEEEKGDILAKVKNLEDELKNLKNKELDILERNSNIKNKITEINSEIKSKEERSGRLKEVIRNVENNININKSTLNGLTLKIKSEEEKLKKSKDEIILKKEILLKLNNNLNKKENEGKIANITLSKLEANKTMLEELESHYEGYNKSLKNLMEKIKNKEIPYKGEINVLGEVFEVPKGYELAIETALGGAISNVITESENVAKNLIKYLKEKRLGRITFLPLNIINGRRISIDNRIKEIEGYLGIASEIVKYDAKFIKAMDYALGRTIICTNMDSAFKIAKLTGYKNKIVTLEGEILNSGGALTGGSIKGKSSNILGRKRQIEELEERIATGIEKVKEIQVSIEKINIERKKADEEILNYTDKIHEIKIELATNKNELVNLENEIIKLKNSVDSYKEEDLSIENSIIKLNDLLNSHSKTLEEINNKSSWNKERVYELEGLIEKERALMEEYNSNIINVRIKKASLKELLQSKVNDLTRKDKEIEYSKEKIEKIAFENNEYKEVIEKSKKDIHLTKEEIENTKVRIALLDEIFKEDEIKKVSLKDNFRKIDTLINELREIITKEEGEINKREISKAKKEMEVDSSLKKLNEEMDLTYEEALMIANPIEDLEVFKEIIHSIKRRISALGIVNLAAISEYEEVKEKYVFMTSQEEDLEKAKGELLGVIEEMTTKMKGLFKENFKILNKNFNETFKELFKGGTAQLILGEGDELTANIDINVMPPGKKLQNINLMSGGEKVLSAIALLFGILKMKPTPFCILDEIEAALDDANVYRYAEFLKKFSNNIQFIVITHRKGTMEVSDIMYGVTMEEKGVSKVVSVDLRK